MMGRILGLAVALMCGACAQTPIADMSALQTGSLQPLSPAYAHSADAELEYATRKTFAGKVLSAIALERVTGRKPDPARLSDLD